MTFYGMSSDTAMKRYAGGVAKYRASEGKTVEVPYRGPVAGTMSGIDGRGALGDDLYRRGQAEGNAQAHHLHHGRQPVEHGVRQLRFFSEGLATPPGPSVA
jgi:hypothetical protein